jgi:hypothetical protein
MPATIAGSHLGIDTHANRPAANAAGQPIGALYSCSTHNLIYKTDGSSWATWGTLGGGISSGTSFPGSPASGDQFRRTDRQLTYTYDGTRWLCDCLHETALSLPADTTTPNSGTSGNSVGRLPVNSTYDMWLVSMHWHSIIRTTNNGTNFWTFNLVKYTPGGTGTNIITPTTAADTAGQFTTHTTTIGALVQSSAHAMMQVEAVKTLSPGGMDFSGILSHRLVG